MAKREYVLCIVRYFSRVAPPPPSVIRVSNNIAYLGSPKEGPKPRQLLSLPPFPGSPLPGKNSMNVTAISWVKYYLDDIPDRVIQSHYNKGLVNLVPAETFVCFFALFDVSGYLEIFSFGQFWTINCCLITLSFLMLVSFA